MRIQRLRIDGFGHFAEREWGGFERPVTVFYGPNEAGKSTLLEFVRQVLFGYSRANSATYYPALAGGRYGGSVTIVSDGGETVIVQRTSGSHGGALTLTTAEGEPLPDSELQRLLGHSEDVFRKVSTFTLDELHNAALLSDSSVNSQIYSAGMGAANLPSALRSLSDDKGKLFRRGGSTQAVYHAAEKLKGIEERLREVANNAAEYGSLTARLAKAEAEIERLDGLRREHQSRYEQQQRLADAWDDWNALYEVERQLTELPPIGDFPVGGVSRLEALAEGARLARQYHDSTERDVKEARARAEAQIENEAISANAEAIRGIQRGRIFFDGAVHDLPERQSELTEYERSLQEALRYLGQDWDEPRLDTFDMSLVVQDEIRGYQQRLEGARSELRERESVLAQSEASLSEATDAKDKAEQEARAAVDTAGYKNGNVRLAIAGAAAGIVLFAFGAILGGAALIVGAAAGIVLAGMAAYLFVFGRAATDTDAERVRLAREIDSSTALVERRKRRVEKIREDIEEAGRAVEEAGGEWRQWLADRNLRPTFSPETVTDLRGRVELARTHLGNVRTWQERIRAIGKDISGYTEDVVPLAQQFGIAFDESDARTIAAAADRLIELDAAVAERVRERAEAQASLDRAERNLGERKEELSESERALVDLLQSGGAADAEDFRRRADAYTERVDLETKRHPRSIAASQWPWRCIRSVHGEAGGDGLAGYKRCDTRGHGGRRPLRCRCRAPFHRARRGAGRAQAPDQRGGIVAAADGAQPVAGADTGPRARVGGVRHCWKPAQGGAKQVRARAPTRRDTPLAGVLWPHHARALPDGVLAPRQIGDTRYGQQRRHQAAQRVEPGNARATVPVAEIRLYPRLGRAGGAAAGARR